MLSHRPLAIALTLTSALALASPAAAAKNTPQDLGTFGQWQAFKKGDVCYMASVPKKKDESVKKRGNVYCIITHRPKMNSKNVVSLHAGYDYAKGSEATVTITSSGGKDNFKLFTQDNTAWCADSSTDDRLTGLLSGKGTEMTVVGKTSGGKKTTDVYSLSGSSKAYEAINKACGM